MLRTSSYTIYVDLPDRDDELLLVHGYTGAYDHVSRQVADYLRSHEVGRPPKPLYGEWTKTPAPESIEPPSDEVLSTLSERGYLTPLDPAQEEAFFERLTEKLQEREQHGMPSYILMPTYDCNLRCSYCFQDHMRTDCSFRHLLSTMQPAMVDRIFRALPEVEALHGVDPENPGKRNFGFFGGEPLLAQNRGIIEHILQRIRELGPAAIWGVSNGTQLDAYADLLGPEGIERLQITLDGPPEEHDQRRIGADGSGTFEQIARGIDLALERGTKIQVRLNLDRNNIRQIPALVDELYARGWPRQKGFSVYSAPIHASNDQTNRKTTFNSWQLDRALTELREEHPSVSLVGRPDEGIRRRARCLFDGEEDPIPQLRPNFCGAHAKMYIFDPFGDIYACWEKTGDRKIRLGHIEPSGKVQMEQAIQQSWRTRTVASNPVCRRCRYALQCGGGCAILALGQRGELHSNYCDGFASRFRASVAEAYLAHQVGSQQAPFVDRVCDL